MCIFPTGERISETAEVIPSSSVFTLLLNSVTFLNQFQVVVFLVSAKGKIEPLVGSWPLFTVYKVPHRKKKILRIVVFRWRRNITYPYDLELIHSLSFSETLQCIRLSSKHRIWWRTRQARSCPQEASILMVVFGRGGRGQAKTDHLKKRESDNN